MNLRRSQVALAALAITLGSLTACGGSEAGQTTCGELKEKSADEFVEFLKEAGEEEGGDDGDQLVELSEQLEALPDEGKDTAIEAAADQICAGQDDDTKLDDI